MFDSLRTITLEEHMKTRQMTTVFSSAFQALFSCLGNSFFYLKIVQIIFMDLTLGPFRSAKYLNFGGEICHIRISSRSIQETYTLENKFQNF